MADRAAATPTARLLQVAGELKLSLTPAGEVGAQLPGEENTTYRVESPTVRAWLLLRYEERFRDVPPQRCFEDILPLLQAQARRAGRPGPVVDEDPLEVAPLLLGIEALLEAQSSWTGTVRDLRDVLEALVPEGLLPAQRWLHQPGILGNRLHRLREQLNAVGIGVEFDYEAQPRWSVRLERHPVSPQLSGAEAFDYFAEFAGQEGR